MSAEVVVDSGPARRAAVLAGGASSRMGRAKATLAVAGAPLLSYPLAAVRQAGLAPVVVAKADSPLPPLDCPLLIEPDEPRHPLTGIVAALEHARAPIVVVACDAPLVPPALIAALAACDAPFAMPDHPRPQPLIARYSPVLLPRLREALSASASLSAVAEDLGGERIGEGELNPIGEPESMFANANEPADLARIEAALRSRHRG